MRSEVKVTMTPNKRDTFSSHDASKHQNWVSYLKNVGDIIRTQLFMKRVQGQQEDSDMGMVHDTSPSQDASTHQILKSYLK